MVRYMLSAEAKSGLEGISDHLFDVYGAEVSGIHQVPSGCEARYVAFIILSAKSIQQRITVFSVEGNA